MAGYWLTKSDYLKYRIHPAYLWLAKHDKDRTPAFDEVAQATVDQGYAVEDMARRLFPGGYLIDGPLFDGPELSARAMRPGGPEVIFQASVLTIDRLYARSDVIVRSPTGWDLYEVKGSTKVKPEHLHDVAFQRHLLLEQGFQVGRVYVVHVNAQYIRQGDVDAQELLTIEDVTDQVVPLEQETAAGIRAAQGVLELAACPDPGPALCRDWYGWRDVYRHLLGDIPADSVLNLTRLKLDQLVDLTGQGITRIADIPFTFPLGPQQQAQVEVCRAGEPVIHHDKIAHELSQLRYPLYFLDYETFSSAIPMWDGVKPFQQLPFQYSLHVMEAPGGPVEHREYLARGTNYPVPELLERMRQDLGPGGTVIVWNKSFEMICNDAMGVLHPEYAGFLRDVNARVYDLMEIFSKGYYAHPGFMGSASIKHVLPVLVPELSYKDLAIGKGDIAQVRWMKAARGDMAADEAAALYEHLVTYCGQDTLAMVRILEVVTQEAERVITSQIAVAR